ncbi:MAG: type II secretion system GspH family protein [Lachnospiraceae bacterium]|nr:type II secretion system GspH family protein [Lachnospiraceae bacterium]
MRNYVAKLKENSKKGFSLVELIIVIAIMAILVGIVASQVIPYMEKSRKSKDQQQLSTVTTAVVSAIAQNDAAVASFDQDYDTTIGTTLKENLPDLMDNATAAQIQAKFKSKAFKASGLGIYTAYSADGTAKGPADSKGQVVTYVAASNNKTKADLDKNMEAISE